MKKEEFHVFKDGFTGVLYHPDKDLHKGKVLILFGGGDGVFKDTCRIAEKFVSGGLTVFAAAYWKLEGLPQELKGIPLEYLGRISDFLKKQGYESIGLWGISMGAQYALLAASYMPEKFDCVVAASPVWFVTQAVRSFTEMGDGAAFSFGGKDLVYQPFKQLMNAKRLLAECVKRKEFTVRFMYEDIFNDPVKEAVIPVERMKASVLLFSEGYDSMWPAKESSERIIKRLEENVYPYPYAHIHYEKGSHYMLPCRLSTDFVFRSERKYRKDSLWIKEDIYQKTMAFLKEKW